MKVDRYVEPAEFDKWKQVAEDMGFLYVASGPLVRSSYKVSCFILSATFRLTTEKAGEYFIENVLRGKAAEQQAKRLIASEGVEANSLSASWTTVTHLSFNDRFWTPYVPTLLMR